MYLVIATAVADISQVDRHGEYRAEFEVYGETSGSCRIWPRSTFGHDCQQERIGTRNVKKKEVDSKLSLISPTW
jgi:hypothetical protein